MDDPSRDETPPSSLGDPLDCLSPRPVHRARLAPLPSPVQPTPLVKRSPKGQSPLKRPRLSLADKQVELVSSRPGRQADEAAGSELEDGSEDSDVVPTSDAEEQQLGPLPSSSRPAVGDGWLVADGREKAWSARMRGLRQPSSSPASSPLPTRLQVSLISSRTHQGRYQPHLC